MFLRTVMRKPAPRWMLYALAALMAITALEVCGIFWLTHSVGEHRFAVTAPARPALVIIRNSTKR